MFRCVFIQLLLIVLASAIEKLYAFIDGNAESYWVDSWDERVDVSRGVWQINPILIGVKNNEEGNF